MRLLPLAILVLAAWVSGIVQAAEMPPPAGITGQFRDPGPALLHGANLFKQISGIAATGDQSQFGSAISSIHAQTPDILSALPAPKQAEFLQLANALVDALSRGRRNDVALYSIETYQFLFARIAPAG